MSEVVPKHSDIGWLEVEIVWVDDLGSSPRYKIGYCKYLLNSCVQLIEEGQGLSNWLEAHTDIKEPGQYRIEGIRSEHCPGDDPYEDSYELWFFDKVIRLDHSPLPGLEQEPYSSK